MDQNSIDEFEKTYSNSQNTRRVLIAGMVMYAGGVLFGLFRNLQLFEPTISGSDYSQIGYVAVILLAANAFVLPLFIHFRASGTQFLFAIAFYVIEMTIYVMNAAVEPRAAQIAQNTQWGFWEWYYWNIAFVAPILVMVGWGVLFLLDEESEMSRAIAEARGALVRSWSNKAKIAALRPQTTEVVTAKADTFVSALNDAILPRSLYVNLKPDEARQNNGNHPETVPN